MVRQTFQEVLALCGDQQSQIDRCLQKLDGKISNQELQQELAQKADVQDVSNAMTEVIVTTDCRKEVDNLKQQIVQYKQEIDMEQNKHVKQMFEGFRKETQNLLRQIQASEDMT